MVEQEKLEMETELQQLKQAAETFNTQENPLKPVASVEFGGEEGSTEALKDFLGSKQ